MILVTKTSDQARQRGCMYVCMVIIITYIKSKDQSGKVANLARGQLNRENWYFLFLLFAPESLVSRDGFGSPVSRQPAHLHTQAESGANSYLVRDSSRFPRRRSFIYFNRHTPSPPDFRGGVHLFTLTAIRHRVSPGHAIAYRWRSLPRVRRHRASKPQGSSKRVLPWQLTMDQWICASLSHTHYWKWTCWNYRRVYVHSH